MVHDLSSRFKIHLVYQTNLVPECMIDYQSYWYEILVLVAWTDLLWSCAVGFAGLQSSARLYTPILNCQNLLNMSRHIAHMFAKTLNVGYHAPGLGFESRLITQKFTLVGPWNRQCSLGGLKPPPTRRRKFCRRRNLVLRFLVRFGCLFIYLLYDTIRYDRRD